LNWKEILKEWGFNKYKSMRLFAEALGISASQLSRMLNADEGKFEPEFPFFKKLRELGFNLNSLFDKPSELSFKGTKEREIVYGSNLTQSLAEINKTMNSFIQVTANLKEKLNESEQKELLKQFYYFKSIIKEMIVIIIRLQVNKASQEYSLEMDEQINSLLIDTTKMTNTLDDYFSKID
jgi:transcriptional regulator with XRE-family HTH domain